MSLWSDVLGGLQRAALLKDKVDRAMTIAEEARLHSIENRERIVALETIMNITARRQFPQPRLPRG